LMSAITSDIERIQFAVSQTAADMLKQSFTLVFLLGVLFYYDWRLALISMVFSKDLSYFFESDPAAMFRVHRKKDRVRMPQTGVEPPAYTFESLGYMVPDRLMDPYIAEFVPQSQQVEPKAHVHPGYEFLYMLGGQLALLHGGRETVLDPGDAIYFDSATPHSYRCSGGKPAEAIIVALHPLPGNQPLPLRPGPTAMPRPVTAPPAAAATEKQEKV